MRWLAAVALVLSASSAQAKGKGQGDPLLGSITYVDGAQKRRVWLDPRAIAEFAASDGGAAAVKAVDPAATVAKRAGGVRLWLLSADVSAALEQLAARRPGQRFARVYRDAPSTAGRARALTGNLVVTLAPSVSPAAVRKLLASKRLELRRSLPAPPNTALVQPPKGSDPLALAESLAKTRGVVHATADWWLEVAVR